MRTIMNVSLPPEMTKEVNRAIKEGGFATKSEFFRHLFRLWKEQELLRELNEADKEFKAGKGILLKSFKDLR